MTATLQILPQLGVVIDLAIKHHPNAAVFIGNRLMAAGKIDNAETAKTKTNTRPDIDALVVRTTVNNGLVHPVDEVSGNLLFPLKLEYARDPAHMTVS